MNSKTGSADDDSVEVLRRTDSVLVVTAKWKNHVTG